MTEIERSLKNLRHLLPVVDNIFGINNENKLSKPSFVPLANIKISMGIGPDTGESQCLGYIQQGFLHASL